MTTEIAIGVLLLLALALWALGAAWGTRNYVPPERSAAAAERRRLEEAHKRNQEALAKSCTERQAACPHANTRTDVFDGVTYCADCGLRGDA